MLAGGALYAASARHPVLLHGVSLCLALNWLGDSLDGAVARRRGRERPRYGYYVDHMLDNVGVAALLAGLGVSGLMDLRVLAVVVPLYLLLQLHMHMGTYTLGVFRLAFGGFGGTEMRLLLIGGNTLVFVQPSVRAAGWELRWFDLAGGLSAVGLSVALLMAVTAQIRTLRRLEGG
jgi:phosphatidylglycerophosphate synthase